MDTDKKKRGCSGKTEVYSRVSGYYSPTARWNKGKGKDGEFGERKKFELKDKKKNLDISKSL